MCRFYDPLIGVLDRKTYTSWYLPSFDLKASFPDDLGTPCLCFASGTLPHTSTLDVKLHVTRQPLFVHMAARPSEGLSDPLPCGCVCA